jgi:4-amino-4-deoxy-L-arabinose transferase-like glycosyltransferase
VTPRNNFELYFEKPPLVYWLEAGAIRIFGANEFAVRLPAAIFSIGQVVVTAAIAEAMLGATAGMLAALVLALSPLFFAFARFATLDPALGFFLTAALGCFYAAARADSFRAPNARRWMFASAAMLAFATLAKGPVALILCGAIALLWLALEGRIRDALALPFMRCALIFLAIVAPWFVLAEARNPGFLRFFFIHEHVQRYLSSREHGWGPWFFIPIILGGTWPWIFFAPLGFSAMRAPVTSDVPPHHGDSRSEARFLLVWFFVIFVFFSIPRSKLGTYILPALPPLAILAGYGLSRLPELSLEARRRILRIFTIINLLLAIAAIVAFRNYLSPAQPLLALDGIVAAIFLAADVILMYFMAMSSRYVRFAFVALVLAMGNALAVANRAREHAAPLSTYRNLAREIQPWLQDDCVLASYRHYVQSLPFYTGYRETRALYWGELSEVSLAAPGTKSPYLIGSDARLQQVWSSGACMILVANRRDLGGLEKLLSPAPSIIGCEGKKLALFNKPVVSVKSGNNCRDLPDPGS